MKVRVMVQWLVFTHLSPHHTPHTAMSYQKTMRFFQAFGFVGALFVMALVAWVALMLGLVSTWFSRTEVLD